MLVRLLPSFSSALFALILLSSPAVHASRGEDSLRSVLDGVSDPGARGRALCALAQRIVADKPMEALAHSRSALVFAQEAKDAELQHELLVLQCAVHAGSSDYDALLHAGIKATELSHSMGDARLIAADYQWMSLAYERIGDSGRALEMSKRALLMLKTTGDAQAIGDGMMHVMNCLVKAGRFEDVIRHGEEAMNYFEGDRDTLGRALLQLHSANAMIAQERYADALPLLHTAYRTLRSSDRNSDLGSISLALAKAFAGLERYQTALGHVDSAQYHFDMASSRAELPNVMLVRSGIMEAIGEPAIALALFKRATAMKDGLMNDRLLDRMAGLTGLYDLRSKDSENEALRLQSAASADQAAQANFHLRVEAGLLVVFAGAMVALAIGWARNRRVARVARMRSDVIQRQTRAIEQQNLDLQRQNMRLAEILVSDEEKDLLLREIHHRVKNNLEVINALLRIQGSHLGDPRVEAAFAEVRGRIHAMACLHEILYKGPHVGEADAAEHFTAVADGVIGGFGLKGRLEVRLEVVRERFGLDTLIPLGLVVNELITDSAKHVLKSGQRSVVEIALRGGNGSYELIYGNGGAGPAGEHALVAGRFGNDLIRLLAQQLGGQVSVLRGDSTAITLEFKTKVGTVLKMAS